MKKMVEVSICDKCEEKEVVSQCLHCGLEVCMDCFQDVGNYYSMYSTALKVGRRKDSGFFCYECESRLISGDTYNELFGVFKEFEVYMQAAEKTVNYFEHEIFRLIDTVDYARTRHHQREYKKTMKLSDYVDFFEKRMKA